MTTPIVHLLHVTLGGHLSISETDDDPCKFVQEPVWSLGQDLVLAWPISLCLGGIKADPDWNTRQLLVLDGKMQPVPSL